MSNKDRHKDLIVVNMAEIQDRHRWKNNIIIFNIKECASESSEERKEYDMAEVTDLFSVELSIETTMTNPVRLGPKKDHMQWLRPLHITEVNEATKWKILKESKTWDIQGRSRSRR